MRVWTRLLAAGTLIVSVSPMCAANEFAGKTINIIVGYSAGGGYDVYSRVLARAMPAFIPGQPNVVVQNMPGAGSAKAASFIYSLAPPDGTAIGSVSPGVIVAPLLDPSPETKYDPTKFKYIGTADSGTRVCVTLKTSGVGSFEDARKQRTVIGAVAPGSSTFDYAWLHKKTSGANFDVITGYPGSAEIALAMERGEVDGMCGLDWSSLKSQRPDWVRDKTMNVLVQAALAPNSELTALGVPEVWRFVDTEQNRKVNELIFAQQVFGRPYILPPATPQAKVDILRAAFDNVLQDRMFLAEAERLGLGVAPADGATVQAAVDKMFATPKPVVEAARAAIAP